LIGAKARGKPEDAQKKVALKLEREVNMMGFAEYTVPYGSKTQSYADKKTFAKKIESKIQISGADASFKLTFKHVNP
jgi:hypothetical protein